MPEINEIVQQSVPTPPGLDLGKIHARAQTMREGQRARARGLFAGISVAIVILLAAGITQLPSDDLGSDVAMGGQSAGAVSLAAISGLSVTDPNGGMLSLADYPDTPLLVYIWAPWCGPCPAVLPDLQTVATDLDDVAVVTIAIQTDREAVSEVLNETRVSLPTILLEDPQALAALLPDGHPVPLATFTPASQGNPQNGPRPTATTTGAAQASEVAPLAEVHSGPVASPLPSPTSVVPMTVALDANHRPVEAIYGAPPLDRLRHLGAQAAAGREPDPARTAAPQATASLPDPIATSVPQPALAATELPACVLDGVVNAPSNPQSGVLAYCSSAVSVSGVGGGNSGLPRTVPVQPNTVWIHSDPDALRCMEQAIADHHQRTGVADLGIAEAAATCGVLIEHYLPSEEMLVGTTEFSDDHTDPYLNPATGGMAEDGTLTDVITPE